MPGNVSVLTVLGQFSWPWETFSTRKIKPFISGWLNCIVKYLFSFIVLVHFIFYILRESSIGSPLCVFHIYNFISHVCNSFHFVFFYSSFTYLSLYPLFCFLQCLFCILHLNAFVFISVVFILFISTSSLSFASHISL